MKIVALLLIVMAWAVATSPREQGYEQMQNNKWYKLFTTEVSSWEEAKTSCNDTGGILARPVNLYDNDQIRVFLKSKVNTRTGFYIGLNDKDSEGEYHFASMKNDSYLKYTDEVNPGWNDNDGNDMGEPNDEKAEGEEDCVVYVFDKENDRNWWNDVTCNQTRKYICQYGKDPNEE